MSDATATDDVYVGSVAKLNLLLLVYLYH